MESLQSEIMKVLSTNLVQRQRRAASCGDNLHLEVTACFMALAASARPGFLYDQSKLSISCALRIAQGLASTLDVFEDLVVAEFSQDIVFLKLKSALKYMHSGTICCINVGGKRPTIIKDQHHLKLSSFFEAWKMGKENLQDCAMNIDECDFSSGPTVIGLLLGFPVVYYLQADTDLHCLNDESLRVTKCSISLSQRNFSICSFTVPAECLDNDLNQTLSEWDCSFTNCMMSMNLNCNISHNVESFSCLVL